MIVATEQLGAHRGRVAMVDGGFDPLHGGHVAYFREAARLGVRPGRLFTGGRANRRLTM
jgi:glycerol-3-phosphate cytidylyltransferase-like family protein